MYDLMDLIECLTAMKNIPNRMPDCCTQTKKLDLESDDDDGDSDKNVVRIFVNNICLKILFSSSDISVGYCIFSKACCSTSSWVGGHFLFILGLAIPYESKSKFQEGQVC
jgi:hypothetical protein